jgi:hypothetical protein
VARTTKTAQKHHAGQHPERLADDERLLVRAADLVRLGWCRGALAQDAGGRNVEPWVDSAVRWSLLGALMKAWYEPQPRSPGRFEVAWAAVKLATGGAPEEWNAAPWRTEWHVLAAFERAREYLPDARRRVGASA